MQSIDYTYMRFFVQIHNQRSKHHPKYKHWVLYGKAVLHVSDGEDTLSLLSARFESQWWKPLASLIIVYELEDTHYYYSYESPCTGLKDEWKQDDWRSDIYINDFYKIAQFPDIPQPIS